MALMELPGAPRGLTAAVHTVRGADYVRLLDADPDLAAGIAPEQRPSARRCAVAPVLELDGRPRTTLPPPAPGTLGDIVLDGMIYLRVASGRRAHGELLGPGDVIAPWADLGADAVLVATIRARALCPTRVARLDRKFALLSARWPEISATVIQRLIVRTRRLGLQNAVNALPRIDERLELTLWGLADRFGRVTSHGMLLRLPLAHAQLAEIMGSQRPSVTCALRRLEERGRLRRPTRHEWLLCGSPPQDFASPKPQRAVERPRLDDRTVARLERLRARGPLGPTALSDFANGVNDGSDRASAPAFSDCR